MLRNAFRRLSSSAKAAANNYFNEAFLTSTSSEYLDSLYKLYCHTPDQVPASWHEYFQNQQQRQLLPTTTTRTAPHPPGLLQPVTACSDLATVQEHLKIQLLVRAFQVRGHLKAKLDPLGINQGDQHYPAPELDLGYYGFGQTDLGKKFFLGEGVLPAFTQQHQDNQLSLGELYNALQQIYCGTVGYEYTHIADRNLCNWIRARIELPRNYSQNPYEYTPEERKVILDRMVWSDSFERFVATKYPAEKRFGLEGCEALIPGMKAMIDRSVDHGTQAIVLGMAHRGRLNVLSNVIRKPNESIFCEFAGIATTSVETAASGDVKYHLGMHYDRPTPSGDMVRLYLVANPSHLEAVNPVVIGKTRGLQFYKNNAMAVLIHGDAAFAGQGVVYETLGMSRLPSYSVNGTIHVIINNQIGFTTDPRFARSTPYPSDVAKAIEAPIIHVNADDVEAVVHAFKLAADWRHAFKSDVVIDLMCYRRHGHNEVDQPAFTQPRMYRAIAAKPRALDIYADQLVNEGAITKEDVKENLERVWSYLEETYARSRDYKPEVREWVTSNWNGFKSIREMRSITVNSDPTGVELDRLKRIGIASASYPDHFDVHKGLQKILETRRNTVESGTDVDMPTAEALAFGTLLEEGVHVRLSGQDVERGTFSQRHAVLNNQSTEGTYVPLAHIDSKQAPFTVCNSNLSEFGILGFELGYSLVSPRSLVLWEAQFGDFCNSAQVIIDQFIASGEKKWLQRTGLTLLLPHGYDGAGPEHSNGRIERFLSLCDDDFRNIASESALSRQLQDCNIQVVYPSTPANYFHVLRRQVVREYRKPLVVFNSKSLLRHPMARSTLAEMGPRTHFQPIIPANPKRVKKVSRVVLCSGQVYYALEKARVLNELDHVAIVRLEQLSPLPFELLVSELDRYPAEADIIYCQEEPMNLGPFPYVEPRLEAALRAHSKKHAGKRAAYAGRKLTAAVATGFKSVHVQEELELLAQALVGDANAEIESMHAGFPKWHKAN